MINNYKIYVSKTTYYEYDYEEGYSNYSHDEGEKRTVTIGCDFNDRIKVCLIRGNRIIGNMDLDFLMIEEPFSILVNGIEQLGNLCFTSF